MSNRPAEQDDANTEPGAGVRAWSDRAFIREKHAAAPESMLACEAGLAYDEQEV